MDKRKKAIAKHLLKFKSINKRFFPSDKVIFHRLDVEQQFILGLILSSKTRKQRINHNRRMRKVRSEN